MYLLKVICIVNFVYYRFVHFNIEAHSRCDFDYVDIYDGADFSAPHIGRFCGEITPDVIKSTGNNLFVNFVSDTSITHSGFTAFYWATFGKINFYLKETVTDTNYLIYMLLM